jgi:tRNA(fMet)-specific endonuclease VapC
VRYLLNTNIISALMRERDGAIARKLEDVGEANVFTSSIVQGELWFGAVRKGSERLIAEVRGLFERLAVEPVASSASQT